MTIRYFVRGDDTASAESDACAARRLDAGYVECTQATYLSVRAERDTARRLELAAEQAARVPKAAPDATPPGYVKYVIKQD